VRYTIPMNTANHAETTELPASCASHPMGKAIRLIGDVWTLLIVMTLLPGPRRFNELRDAVGHVSTKTLSQRLKMLEHLQMVERRAFLEIPPRVEYRLTEKGKALGDVLGAIEQFALQHLSTVDPCVGVEKEPIVPVGDDL
jgi:DNA-binding HxlR family transcriptional regulator